MNKFENELIHCDIMNKIDTSPLADPNKNYLIIHETIESAKCKHIPF